MRRLVMAESPLKRIDLLARLTLAFVWIWHGLVPKLLVNHPDEYAPLLAAGVSEGMSRMMIALAGWGEILFGILILLLWRSRWPLILSIVVMTFLLIGMVITTPRLALGPFNPVTLNVLVSGLAGIALLCRSVNNREGSGE